MPSQTSDESRPRRRAAPALVAVMVGGLATVAFSLTAIAAAGREELIVPPADPSTVTLGSGRHLGRPPGLRPRPGQRVARPLRHPRRRRAVGSADRLRPRLECRVQTVEPGSPYVGGQQAHRVRNETAEPVDMIVSYLSPRAAADSTRHISASAC